MIQSKKNNYSIIILIAFIWILFRLFLSFYIHNFFENISIVFKNKILFNLLIYSFFYLVCFLNPFASIFLYFVNLKKKFIVCPTPYLKISEQLKNRFKHSIKMLIIINVFILVFIMGTYFNLNSFYQMLDGYVILKSIPVIVILLIFSFWSFNVFMITLSEHKSFYTIYKRAYIIFSQSMVTPLFLFVIYLIISCYDFLYQSPFSTIIHSIVSILIWYYMYIHYIKTLLNKYGKLV